MSKLQGRSQHSILNTLHSSLFRIQSLPGHTTDLRDKTRTPTGFSSSDGLVQYLQVEALHYNSGRPRMSGTRILRRFSLCIVGVHKAPPRRQPHGAIVADCVCCGRTHCFYGSSAKANRLNGALEAPVTALMLEPVRIKLLGPVKRDVIMISDR